MIPDVAGRLTGTGVEVAVQAGAGAEAHFTDAAYAEKGATVVGSVAELMTGAQMMAKVQAPTPPEVDTAPEGITVVSFLAPAAQLDTVKALVQKKATAFSLDLLPRISRAQSMDALSSQSTVSGYLGRPGRRRTAAQVLPHVHDGPPARSRRPRSSSRGGSGRAADDRHRPATRGPGPGL